MTTDKRTLNEVAESFGLRSEELLTEGYTHYWKVKRDFTPQEWSKIKAEAHRLIDAAKADGITIKGGDGTSAPEISDKEIWINGDDKGDKSHETFTLSKSKDDNFCKTARKPYDAYVVSLLAFAKKIAPDAISVSSNGGPSAIQKVL